MRTKHVIVVCTIVCLFSFSRAWAHALWIETAPIGKSGNAHEVRIYYGEPSEGVLEDVADWWSDVASFDLTLHLPDGSSKPLAVTAKSDHYLATFTPEGDGLYALRVTKPVAETFDGHKYQFNSAAFVHVGAKPAQRTKHMGDFCLLARSSGMEAIGKAIAVDARLEGEPLADLEVTVFSPNGWEKTFRTDGKGAISFVPDRPGHYLVEALYSIDVVNADHKHLHRIATWSVNID